MLIISRPKMPITTPAAKPTINATTKAVYSIAISLSSNSVYSFFFIVLSYANPTPEGWVSLVVLLLNNRNFGA